MQEIKQLVKCSICRKYKEIESYTVTVDMALCANCNRMPLKQVMDMIRKYEGTI